MNDTEGMRRLVEATERVAKALERMADQQAEFLATMPAEDGTMPYGSPLRVGDELTVGIGGPLPESPKPSSMDAALDDMAGVVAGDWPVHDYSSLCACPHCWAERRHLKRTDAP